MEEQGKSCWGLTTKVVLFIAGVMVMTWLVGGHEGSLLLASAAG